MLMVAKGHYSIDVVSFLSILIYLIVNRIAKIIAYFVTTRLWYILHSIINTRQLQTRTSANFLSRSAALVLHKVNFIISALTGFGGGD